MPSLENGTTQAFLRYSIYAHVYFLIKKSIHGFCYRLSSINKLEKRNLRLNFGDCELLNKKDILQANLNYYKCSKPGKSYRTWLYNITNWQTRLLVSKAWYLPPSFGFCSFTF